MRHFRKLCLIFVLFQTLFLFHDTKAQHVSNDSLIINYQDHGLGLRKERFTIAEINYRGRALKQCRSKLIIRLENLGALEASNFKLIAVHHKLIRDINDYHYHIPYSLYHPNTLKDGSLLFYINSAKLESTNLYLCVDSNFSADAIGKSLCYKISSICLNDKKIQIKTNVPYSSRRIFYRYKALFTPEDNDSKHYRIPAIIHTSKGSLIAFADKRKYNQADLPEDIDIVYRRSTDEGKTWSGTKTLAKGTGRNHGYGDFAIVETSKGKLVGIFAGGVGLWASTPTNPFHLYSVESNDDGSTWSRPKDITSQIYGEKCIVPERRHWWSLFCTSGKGLCSTSGRIMFVLSVREGKAWSLNNYVMYSDDEGQSWQLSGPAYVGGDESKLIEAQDGKIIMSIRNKKKGFRINNVSLDNGISWATPSVWKDISDPACNGGLISYKDTLSGKVYILHSIPNSKLRRENGSIFISDDYGKSWKWHKSIYSGSTAYTDISVLQNGNIAYFAEEDNPISLIYVEIPFSYLIGNK